MTEHEWLKTDDVYQMLWFLKGKDTPRKMRLFGCACCRSVWHRLTDTRYRAAVENAEQYVEGDTGDEEREAARLEARAAMFDAQNMTQNDPSWALKGEFIALLVSELISASQLTWLFNEKTQRVNPLGDPSDRVNQASLLRDLFGSDLFHNVKVSPIWITSTVSALAQTVYVEKSFELLPILADALEDAGCNDAEILSHCRGSTPHVRGCWVVDLILGKK